MPAGRIVAGVIGDSALHLNYINEGNYTGTRGPTNSGIARYNNNCYDGCRLAYETRNTDSGTARVLNAGMNVNDTRNSGRGSSVSIVTRIRLNVWGSIPARDTMPMGLLTYGWRYGEFHYKRH